jgi:tripartite-type tricarboxylate transporter receptor subunit TctC
VVPFAAGGSTDALARIVGQQLSTRLGQPVTIDNRPGASGAIGAEAVAKSAPDGYTLFLATSTHAVLQHLRPLPYDPVADFTPVSVIGFAPNLLVVSPGSNITTVAQLVASEKARKGLLVFSSSGASSFTHLIGEAFAQQAGFKATHVPYKTGVLALPDISSGQVDFAFDSIVWTLPQARAGKVRALGIASSKRSPLAPDLPTVAEGGYPGFEGTTWFGIMGPRGLPPAITTELNRQIEQILQDPGVRKQFDGIGAEPGGGSADSFARLVRADSAKWAEVISKGNIKVPQ